MMKLESTHAHWPWLMLFSRSFLFFTFQAIIALVFLALNNQAAWDASAAWWPLGVVLTNFVCLGLLIRLYQQEGKSFWRLFRIERQHLKSDLLVMLVILVLSGPIALLPNILSASWLFGNPQTALDLLVCPLPAWAALATLVLFPVTQGMAEVPTYMLYVRPRLEMKGVHPWLAVLLVSLMLSAQHMFIPFLPNIPFLIYRLVMFLPFAFYLALIMRWRPRLMPYIAVLHALLDLSLAFMFLPLMT